MTTKKELLELMAEINLATQADEKRILKATHRTIKKNLDIYKNYYRYNSKILKILEIKNLETSIIESVQDIQSAREIVHLIYSLKEERSMRSH